MKLRAFKTELQKIQSLRALYLQENNFQIRYNACHERKWSDTYLLTLGDVNIAYGAIKGKEELADRDAVFEFFVVPPFRKIASKIFIELLRTSGAAFIECQSNDLLLSSMLYEFANGIYADVFLFEDHVTTEYNNPGVIFRKKRDGDTIFHHQLEPVGEYVLELKGEIVATGGFMLHYNIPFADLYMEVKESSRRRGLGSFLLQELKRECYLSGRVPAARCSIENVASRETLVKAGLTISGFMLTADVKRMSRE